MFRKKVAMVLALTLCALLLVCVGVQQFRLTWNQQIALEELREKEGEYDPQSIVLANTSESKAKAMAEKLDAGLRITKDGTYAALTLPDGISILDVYADVENRELIEEMSADYRASVFESEEVLFHREPAKPQYTVFDTGYSQQGYLDYLNLGPVWNTTKGSGVLVAVIDSGIDTDHPDFTGKISEFSYNASQDKVVKDYDLSIIEDYQGHGTAVAGVIAASMDGQGTVGIVPDAELLVIKAECDEYGNFARTSDLVFGLYYAIERGANVVNMSFGSMDLSNPFEAPCRLAVDNDVICIAAAGNNGSAANTFPAADVNVIGVGSMMDNGWDLAEYSNYGENVNLVAPGTVYTTLLDGEYGAMEGTSFSAPIVSATVALYLSQNPYQTVEHVEELLYASCTDLGSSGKDWLYGYGALDVEAMILRQRGTVIFDMQTDELRDETQIFVQGIALQSIPEPERLYAVFDGWYYDAQCTEEFQRYEESFGADLTLYAKWVNEEETLPFTYEVRKDGSVEITGYTGKRRFITVPEYIEGLPVRSIGNGAFSQENELRSVKLPDTLVQIGDSAFEGCVRLMQMEIPDSVERIGSYAFHGCVRLNAIALSHDSNLYSIGKYAFHGCSRLERFEVPKSLREMDGSALYGTISLTAITVRPGNVAFASRNGVLFNKSGTVLVAYPASMRGEYKVPDSVRTIGICAFGNSLANNVDLNQVTEIKESAFSGSKLQSVIIPDSVIAIGNCAFMSCSSVREVHLSSGMETISGSTFFRCCSLSQIEIPANITSIEDSAFGGCESLQLVTFESGSNLSYIGRNAFERSNLRQIQIPASVAYIDAEAFLGTSNLKAVTFAEGSMLTGIGDSAFRNTGSLVDITFPDSLVSLGDYAFANSGIRQIRLGNNFEMLGMGAFASCHNLSGIDVPADNIYFTSKDGVVYDAEEQSLLVYPAGKADAVFAVPDHISKIGNGAFYGSWKLNEIIVPASVSVVSEYAFYDCRNVTSYQLQEGLTTLESYAFANNQSLGFFNFPDTVEQIGRYAFSGNYRLSTVYLSEETSLRRLSYASFADSGLVSFRIPACISTVAQGVFEGCTKLEEIVFSEGSQIDSIPAYLFNGCERLTNIVFEPGSELEIISAHGFEGMSNLQVLDLQGTKLRKIGNYAMRFCESLSTLYLPDTLEDIGRFAFYRCENLQSLVLPERLEHIGSYAFYDANDLELYFTADFVPIYLDENWDDSISSYHVGVQEVVSSGDWKYARLNSGNISIVAYLGNDSIVDLRTLDLGGDVVGIGGHAFFESSATEVILPEGLNNIQAYAFTDSRLTNVEIPASVTFIGREAFAGTPLTEVEFTEGSQIRVIEQGAFANTASLDTIVLPATLTQLGSRAFYRSGVDCVVLEEGIALNQIARLTFAESDLNSIVIPDSVTKIDDSAFRSCKSLTSVTLGKGEDLYIGSNVFYDSALTEVYIPENVGYIGEYAFVGLYNLTDFAVSESNPYYSSQDGLLLSGDGRTLIAVPAGKTGSLTIPVSVEQIGFGSFERSSLSAVRFAPDANILTIGCRAFFDADCLTEILVPESVVSIDYYAFANCSSLERVEFDENSRLSGVYEGAFYGCEKLSDVVLPDSLIEISDFAFFNNISLTTLPLRESSEILGIYDYAFAYTGMEELTMPESLIDIGQYSFMGTKVKSITVPSVKQNELFIDLGAFADCNQLEEITLPFVGASFEDFEYSWFGYIFGAGNYTANASYIPDSLKSVTISEGITRLDMAFYQIDKLEKIDIPATVTEVSSDAFYGTKAEFELTNAIYIFRMNREYNQLNDMGAGISGNLIIAGMDEDVEMRFYGCNNLTGVTIQDGSIEIRENMFRDCKNLEVVTLAPGLKEIGRAAFSGCDSLKTITLPEGLETISDEAFVMSIGLQEIVFPDSLTSIGSSAFSGCSALFQVTLGKNLMYIGDYAFSATGNLRIVNNNSSLKLEFGSYDQGMVAFYAELIQDRNGNKYYLDHSEGFTYVDTEDGFRFALKNGAYTLIGYLGAEDTVTLPSDVNGSDYSIYQMQGVKHVIIPGQLKKIPNYAFRNSATLKSVTVLPGVEEIGAGAFSRCNLLESVVLPETVSRIERSAFEVCDKLSSINLPEGIQEIPWDAFWSCENLEQITLPDSVKYISSNAFASCHALKEINMPRNLESIGDRAFASCDSLESIFLGEKVREIGDGAFAECFALADFSIDEKNPYIVVEDGVVYNGDQTRLLFALQSASGEVVIPDTLTEIPPYAFQNCGEITSIVIPESVSEIGRECFDGCTSLMSVTITDSITVLNDGLFRGCVSLESVELPANLSGDNIGNYVFQGCESLVSIKLPEDMTEIKAGLFSGCKSLETIVIPDGVVDISGESFAHCESLKEIHLPDRLENIGSGCFDGCISLTSITIPDGVKTIESRVFTDCTALITVELGEYITKLGYDAFMRCSSLENINLPEGLVSIESNALRSCSNLEELIIPDSVTFIGNMAFFLSSDIRRLVIGDGLTKIDNEMFATCTQLEEVTLGANITSIGNGAFRSENLYTIFNNSDLELTIGSRDHGGIAEYATTIVDKYGNVTQTDEHDYIQTEDGLRFRVENDQYTLLGYYGEEDPLILPATIEGHSYTIGRLDGPKRVVIPASDIVIGAKAFGSTDIESVYIGSGVEIGEFAFDYCLKLSDVTIEEGIESIAEGAFSACMALKKIILPDSVKRIGFGAFQTCTSLEDIHIGPDVTYLGGYIFHDTQVLCDPEYADTGMMVVDGHLFRVSEDVIFCDWDAQGAIADGALSNSYKMKQLEIGYTESGRHYGELTNLEVLIVKETPPEWLVNYVGTPQTLEAVVIQDSADVVSSEMFTFLNGIKIFVEAEYPVVANWDVSYAGWNNGNPVYYGDSWVEVCFYDVEGNLISRDFLLTSEVIRQPHYEIPDDLENTYTLVGWDINGDGQADRIPATSAVDIHAYPVVETNPRNYTVTFFDKDGKTALYSLNLPYGSEITLPDDPERMGYSFLGWKNYSEAMRVESDLEIFSAWSHVGGGHSDYHSEIISAGCTSFGYTKQICGICGEWYETDRVLPLGHSYEQTAIPANCTEGGYDVYVCSGCGDTYYENVAPAVGHQNREWVVTMEPDCETEGTIQQECSVCGLVTQETIPAEGHRMEIVNIVSPDCIHVGQSEYICNVCGSTAIEEIPVTDHSYERISASYETVLQLAQAIPELLWGNNGTEYFYYSCNICGLLRNRGTSDSVQSETAGDECSHTDAPWKMVQQQGCETDGIEWRQCGLCNNIFEARIYSRAGHVWDKGVVTIVPNDVQLGEMLYKCTICGETKTETIVELPEDICKHSSAVLVNQKDATCTETGYSGDKVCSDCGFTIEVGSESEKLPHSEVVDEPVTATCTTEGKTEGKHCAVCGEILVAQEIVDKLAHTEEVIPGKPATETETGLTDGIKCSVCGEILKEQEVIDKLPPSHVHDYKAVVTEATCTEKGYTTHTCSCGDRFMDNEVEALGHDFSEYVSDGNATCTEDGTKTAKCDRCEVKDTIVDEGSATGHKWNDGEITKAPDAGVEGERTYTCESCGDTRTEVIPALPEECKHTDTELVGQKDATCTESGYSGDKVCTVCGETIETGTELPMVEHEAVIDEAVEATCTTTGLTEGMHCAVCETVLEKQEVIEALGHDFGEWEVETEATCTERGEELRFCAACDAFESRQTEATGHSFTDYVSDDNATCTEDGTKTAVCDNCDAEDTVAEEGSAIGHDWDDGKITKEPEIGVEGIKTFTCDNCGETRTESIPALPEGPEEVCNHSSVKLVNQKDATCTEEGYSGDKVCKVCQELVQEGETVPAKGHKEVTDQAVAATCTKDGKTEGKHCSVCEEILVKQKTVSATGHSFGQWKVTVPATSQAKGEEMRSCETCGLEEKRSTDKLVNPFSDVAAGAYYEAPVLWAVSKNVTSGIGNGMFGPDQSCLRSQVVTFLWRAAGEPEPASTKNPFVDVKTTDYFYKAVLWAVEEGITTGMDATHFGYDKECTRAQVATFLWRSQNKPSANGSNPFRDAKKGEYYYDAVLWAVENGVTTGTSSTTFSPDATCTRGQIVTFLYRAIA